MRTMATLPEPLLQCHLLVQRGIKCTTCTAYNDTWTEEHARIYRPLCAIFEPPYNLRPASGNRPVGSQVYSLSARTTARKSSAMSTTEKSGLLMTHNAKSSRSTPLESSATECSFGSVQSPRRRLRGTRASKTRQHAPGEIRRPVKCIRFPSPLDGRPSLCLSRSVRRAICS